MEENKAKVKSLYKALRLLDCFDIKNPELGIKELSERSGLLKSSVHNIVSTFQMCGFIEKNSASGKYRLGKKLLTLSNILYSTDQIKAIVKPYMDKISEECNETVYLAFPSDTDVVYVEGSYPRGMFSTRSIVGVRVKMYCTGVGKAILAYSGEDSLQAVLDDGLKPFTPFTLTKETELRDELDVTRERGYAIDNMEHEHGIRCVGVPVHNHSGQLIGAMSISGPSLRMMDDSLILFAQKLKEAASEIESVLK